MVVLASVHNLSDLPVKRSLDFLLHGARGMRAFVVASRVLALFHLLLPILSPVVAVAGRPVSPRLLLISRIEFSVQFTLHR